LSAGSQASLRFLIVTGESSGDLHGASFLRALRELAPGLHAAGIGGPKLRAAGLECLFPAEDLALVGLPGFRELKTTLSVFRRLLKVIKERPPHLLVLIDFPEFNLWLARFAKRYGVPIFYYIAPQVWAWREGRVKLIRRVVDCLAVILPFEVEFYRRHGIEAHFVGHPLLDVVKPCLSRETFFRLIDLRAEKPLIGLFPGSRRREVETLLPVFVETYQRLKGEIPSLQAVVVQAEGLPEHLFHVHGPDLRVVKGYQYEVMQHAEAVLLASGTVTLEAAIVGVPMVVAYKMPRFSFWLARHLVKVPYVSLVNILAGRRLVPELLQDEAEPSRLAEALKPFLTDKDIAAETRRALNDLSHLLGPPGACWRAAELALNFLRRTLPQKDSVISVP